jgi:hypothetical protein
MTKTSFLKKSPVTILLLLTIVAIILRWWYLPQNAISFAYDQARDAFLVKELISGEMKILGPSVSGVPGLYHGVLYYYVIALPYYLGAGNPIYAAYWMSFISSLGVFTVYLLSYFISKKVTPSILSALIFSVSFESSQYANLLTNASMGVWFVPMIYLGLYLWISRKKDSWIFRISPAITGLALGLAIQSEIASGYHIVPIVFWLIYTKSLNLKNGLQFAIALMGALLTMVIAELKFGFTGTRGIIYLISGGDKIAQSRTFLEIFVIFIKQIVSTLGYNLFPVSVSVGGGISLAAILFSVWSYWKKPKSEFPWQLFLTTYIMAHLFALPFGGTNMRHVMVGAGPGIAVFFGIFIYKYLYAKKLIFLSIILAIVFSNIASILKENINGQTIFPLQIDLVLSKEIEAVDYSYRQANGEEFSISTLTSPLFVNTLWSYMYTWYGFEKYGFLPYWQGRDQIGQPGNYLKFAPSNLRHHFFIIEPTYGIPELWVTYAKGDQEAISDLVEAKNFGEIVVENRIYKK